MQKVAKKRTGIVAMLIAMIVCLIVPATFLFSACGSVDYSGYIKVTDEITAFAEYVEAKNDGKNSLIEYAGENIDAIVPVSAGGNGEITIGDTINHLYSETWGFNRLLIDFLAGEVTIEEVVADISGMVEYHKFVIDEFYLI